MKVVYPIIIKQDPKDGLFLVAVPDLGRCTQGASFYDAIEMGRDIIGMALMDLDDRGVSFPDASTADDAFDKVERDGNIDIDFSSGVLTYVDIDTKAYKNKIRNKAVKKNCTIPAWLNEKAEEQGVNFSHVLQEALIGLVGEA